MQAYLTESVIKTIILYKGEECKVVGWGDGRRHRESVSSSDLQKWPSNYCSNSVNVYSCVMTVVVSKSSGASPQIILHVFPRQLQVNCISFRSLNADYYNYSV